jgi:hypothetical protein
MTGALRGFRLLFVVFDFPCRRSVTTFDDSRHPPSIRAQFTCIIAQARRRVSGSPMRFHLSDPCSAVGGSAYGGLDRSGYPRTAFTYRNLLDQCRLIVLEGASDGRLRNASHYPKCRSRSEGKQTGATEYPPADRSLGIAAGALQLGQLFLSPDEPGVKHPGHGREVRRELAGPMETQSLSPS